MLKDPVCGRRINRGRAHIAIEHERVIYYLCCPRCQAEFEADPERYARPELGEKARGKARRRGRRVAPRRPTGQSLYRVCRSKGPLAAEGLCTTVTG